MLGAQVPTPSCSRDLVAQRWPQSEKWPKKGIFAHSSAIFAYYVGDFGIGQRGKVVQNCVGNPNMKLKKVCRGSWPTKSKELKKMSASRGDFLDSFCSNLGSRWSLGFILGSVVAQGVGNPLDPKMMEFE